MRNEPHDGSSVETQPDKPAADDASRMSTLPSLPILEYEDRREKGRRLPIQIAGIVLLVVMPLLTLFGLAAGSAGCAADVSEREQMLLGLQGLGIAAAGAFGTAVGVWCIND